MRRPRPVYARPNFQRSAERLLGRRVVLENAVEEAILDGRKRAYVPGRKTRPIGPDERFVVLDEARRVAAVVRKGPSPFGRDRLVWHVVSVERV